MVSHTTRTGAVWYLRQGTTSRGKPRYFFSRRSQGDLAETIPEGYEVHENLTNGQVYLRKVALSEGANEEGEGTGAEESGFLKAIKEQPSDTTSRLVYADWLDEQGRAHEAALQRERAGIAEVYYKVRRKSDGLFSEGGERKITWSRKGKLWRQLSSVQGHLSGRRWRASYGNNTSWDDIEVVVVEVRYHLVATVAVSERRIVTEPSPAK